MSPIIATTSTKNVPTKASVSKPKSKKMITNRGPTTTGALKVQQMIEGTFVNGSDTMLHSALLPFKGVYHTCLSCYLVGIEKKYSGITYTQSHGRKCVNRPTFIDWLSKKIELHQLIPQCIEIDEFERADSIPQAKEDQAFSVSHLNHLQTSFNSKISEMKAAADLLSEYTKKATKTAPPTSPPPLPSAALVAPTAAVKPPTVCLNASKTNSTHTRKPSAREVFLNARKTKSTCTCTRKPSARALLAKQSI